MDLFQTLGGVLGGPGGPVSRHLRCHPMVMAEKRPANADNGGKIILPPEMLRDLITREVQYPMMFRLERPQTGQQTHCGVMEFTAPPGTAYLPFWMMQRLGVDVNDVITVTNVSLNKATYAKFQPVKTEFIEISNPKAVLEKVLRDFSALTVNDTIPIHYNNKMYEINVLELQPDSAVSIVETNVQLEFAQPLDYKEPERKPAAAEKVSDSADESMDDAEDDEPPHQQTFTGQGFRIDGKPIGGTSAAAPPSSAKANPRVQALAREGRRQRTTSASVSVDVLPFTFGKLEFPRRKPRQRNVSSGAVTESDESFTGRGRRLRDKKP